MNFSSAATFYGYNRFYKLVKVKTNKNTLLHPGLIVPPSSFYTTFPPPAASATLPPPLPPDSAALFGIRFVWIEKEPENYY